MANLIKLLNEIVDRDPILKEMVEQDNKYIEGRRQCYLDEGFNQHEANSKAQNDFWTKANKDHGVEFSIHKLLD